MASDTDPEIIISPLSQPFYSDGEMVFIEIYRLETESKWALEIEDEFNNTTLWDEEFSSDQDAFITARDAIFNDGIRAFIRSENRGEWGG